MPKTTLTISRALGLNTLEDVPATSPFFQFSALFFGKLGKDKLND